MRLMLFGTSLHCSVSFTAYKTSCVCVRVFQVQTRSADEPMTTFVLCNECGNRWKVRLSLCFNKSYLLYFLKSFQKYCFNTFFSLNFSSADAFQVKPRFFFFFF